MSGRSHLYSDAQHSKNTEDILEDRVKEVLHRLCDILIKSSLQGVCTSQSSHRNLVLFEPKTVHAQQGSSLLSV